MSSSIPSYTHSLSPPSKPSSTHTQIPTYPHHHIPSSCPPNSPTQHHHHHHHHHHYYHRHHHFLSLSLYMASNSLQSLHHHHSLFKRHLSDTPPSILTSSLFLKPATTTTTLSHSSSSTITFSLSSTTSSSSSTPSTSQTISFDLLHQHLSTQNFRQADEETRRLLILLAGEASQKRGYVFFSEAQFISETDLKAIDNLWREHSNNKFGYTVQKRIFEKADKDFSKFFVKVGWMKKLDTEVQQYNYKSFPTEFIWELTDDTPEGHLPLTNALRGTQLLNSILNHPAFNSIEEEEDKEAEKGNENGGLKGLRDSSKPLSETVFKPNYSF